MADEEKPTVLILPLSGGPPRQPAFSFNSIQERELFTILNEAFRKLDSPPSANLRAFVQALELEIGKFKILNDIERERGSRPDFAAGIDRLARQSGRLGEIWRGMSAKDPELLSLCLEYALNSEQELAELVRSEPQGTPWTELTTGVKGLTDDANWARVQENRARGLAVARFVDKLTADLSTLHSAIPQGHDSHASIGQTEPVERRRAGRRKKSWRRELATHVATAFSDCLGITPTSTADGAFEDVLRLVLASADVHVVDLHRLAIEAVKHWQVQKFSPP